MGCLVLSRHQGSASVSLSPSLPQLMLLPPLLLPFPELLSVVGSALCELVTAGPARGVGESPATPWCTPGLPAGEEAPGTELGVVVG